MYYRFESGTGQINAFISLDGEDDRVSWWDTALSCEVQNIMYNNNDGDLVFDGPNGEIKVRDAIKFSMEDIKKAVESGNKNINEYDFLMAIICDGMENVRISVDVSIPLHIIPEANVAICSNSHQAMCPCNVIPGYLCMPHDAYKLRLEPAPETFGYGVCGGKNIYTCDIFSLIMSGCFTIETSIYDGKTAEEHFMEYFTSVIGAKHEEYIKYRMK